MKCYVCMEEGKESDAVAICIVCGMGLCKNHALEVDLPAGLRGIMVDPQDRPLPHILCPRCKAALAG